MADLTVVVAYTRNGSDNPATGLTLADIDLYLDEIDRVTGAVTVIWDGTQHPTAEVTNTGSYVRVLATADMDANNYVGGGLYTGAVVLDCNWVLGSAGVNMIPVGTAIEFTYTVTDAGTGLPIDGVHIEITTDIAGVNVIWCGETDTFGVARDDAGYLPRLDPGTYYFWRNQPGYIFTNPDTEIVS